MYRQHGNHTYIFYETSSINIPAPCSDKESLCWGSGSKKYKIKLQSTRKKLTNLMKEINLEVLQID